MSYLWNVKLSVVGLVEAGSPEEAADALAAGLKEAGFDVYEADAPNVFESEEQP